jgi:BASS family bile acid:Na+ symporter
VTLAQLIPLVLKISIGLVVFCLALRSHPGDLSALLGRPSLLIRSMFAMNVVMPILAIAIAALFDLRPELKVALILLSVAPVPPVLPGKQSKAGGSASYAVGLLMMAGLVSIVAVPLTLEIIARLFGRDVDVPASLIATTVGATVIAPLVLGMVVRRLFPALAQRVARPLSIIGTVMLVVAFLPLLVKFWPAIAAAVGDGTVVAIIVFVVAGLIVGHLLGGPATEDRTVLALATACRHPGVAIGLAGAVTTAETHPAVSATILLAVLVSVAVTTPYVALRKRAHATAAAAPVPAARA